MQSLPLPGAWIEMLRGLGRCVNGVGRSLYWERGLKSVISSVHFIGPMSLPLPGAWIEINRMTNGTQNFYTTDEESNRCLLCAFCHTLSAQFGT